MSRSPSVKSPAQLAAAIAGYFNGISRLVPLSEQQPLLEADGRLLTDEKGKPIYQQKPLISQSGQPLYKEEFITPPSILGLCRSLGLSLAEWRRLEKRPATSRATTAARERIAQYLEEQLLENPKAARGVILNLTANFGWANRQELEIGEETRQALGEQAIPLRDKLALIQALSEENGRLAGESENESSEDD